jgi:putative ABC transport system ATP-binding protein
MTFELSELGAAATIGRGVEAVPELRRGLGLTVVLAVIGAAGRVTVPITIQQAIDRGLGTDEVKLDVIVTLAVIAAVSVIVATIAQRFAVARLGTSSEHALYGLRVKLFDHVHRLSMEDHAEERRGALVARATSDIETLTQFFSWGGLAWLLDGTLMLLVAAVMLAYDWILALVAFAVAAPLFIVLRFVQRRLVTAYDHVRDRNGAMLGQVSEVVTGAAALRAYGGGARAEAQTGLVVRDRANARIRTSKIGAYLFPSGELFSVFTVAAVVLIGVWRGPSSGLTAGAMVGFLFLTYRFLEPIAEFTEILDQTQTAVAGLRRILSVLETPPGPPEPEEPVPLPRGSLGVDIDHVTFVYRARPGLDEDDEPAVMDVSVTIDPGQRVAVVGETGSGKSTIARLLTRLVDPTLGTIRIGDVDIRTVANDDLRSRVMLVPQEPFLFDSSVEGNLSFARPGVSHAEIVAAFSHLDLDDWLSQLPDLLATPVGERGGQLSAGERQLVALVRAYLADPDLLVLDEATSAVDPLTEVRIGRALEHLSEGRTTIAIAHRLSTAARADRVLVMHDGRLVEDGGHNELLARGGVYARLYSHWLSATDSRA